MKIFALLLLWHFSAQAAEVLVQAPTAAPLEYQAALRAHPDWRSPTQSYLLAHPTAAHREQLMTAFTDAQKAFVQSGGTEAAQKLMAVLSLSFEDDWGKTEREIFVLTYLRLAQLEIDGAARDRWLAQSLLFGIDTHVDETLIPPPLLARRQELANQFTSKPQRLETLGEGWTQILVNGRRCPNLDCTHVAQVSGRVRVTFLSDEWLPQTRVIDRDELLSFDPPRVAWAGGDCQNSHLNSQAKALGAAEAFWSVECGHAPVTAALKLTPAPPIVDPLPAVPVERAPLYRSKWLWGGVGVAAIVAGVLILHAQQHHASGPATTTTYGF